MTGTLGGVRDLYAGRLMPTDQILTCQNTHRLFPTRPVRKGGASKPFRAAPEGLADIDIASAGQRFDLVDYMARNRVVGLLVLRHRQVLLERYEYGVGPGTRWMSMSMAKSVATTLVGAAVHDGFIGSVDDPLVDYLPGLAGTAYDGVSIRHLMCMTSGVGWDDTHTDPASDRRHMLELQIAQRPGTILDYMAARPRVAEPGAVWNYSTGDTHVVGALLKAATGKWLADYLSETLWSRFGAEADAAWWLESADGLEVAGAGLCATLRDYARFGLFMMDDGVIDGHRVLPDGWVAQATRPGLACEAGLNYGYMWWLVPDAAGSFADGAYSARGIFGQYIYINPARDVVVAVISARAKPRFSEVIPDNDFFNAVAAL